ncbi:MAG: HEAT repeat domain-containing protein [Nitrospira sp.]|nr:HEAT repeat domain-containing protein [Nitrospira sp.]
MERLCVWVVLALSIALVDPGKAFGGEGSFVTVEELKRVLRTKNVDHIIETLNDVKIMRYQGEILPFVEDLWVGKATDYQDLPLDIVNLLIVKVEFANILLQAERNGRIKTDRERMYRFVEPLVYSSDMQLAMSAILTLSLVDEERTTKAIVAVAEQENRATFRAAVISLSWMCDPSARRGLEELIPRVKSGENKSIIRNTLQESESKKHKAGLCDRQ